MGLSERPRMVLDSRNNKFYRYYEFLILDQGTIKGSILIPAYKKTENFFTSEVRVYNNDQITFKSFPTKWGEFASSQFPEIKIEQNSNVDTAFEKIFDDILKYNHITEYDIYYKQISEELTNEKLLPVQGNMKSEISNLIDHETTIKFSNNVEVSRFLACISSISSGGCGSGVGCGSSQVHTNYDLKKPKNAKRNPVKK